MKLIKIFIFLLAAFVLNARKHKKGPNCEQIELYVKSWALCREGCEKKGCKAAAVAESESGHSLQCECKNK
jgi:hypothetical protein